MAFFLGLRLRGEITVPYYKILAICIGLICYFADSGPQQYEAYSEMCMCEPLLINSATVTLFGKTPKLVFSLNAQMVCALFTALE